MCIINPNPGLGWGDYGSTWVSPLWDRKTTLPDYTALFSGLAQYASYTFREQRGPGGLQLELDIPGVAPENVEVKFEQGELKVSAKRFVLGVEKQVENSWAYGKLEDADVASITSVLMNGVLIITVPFKPEAQRTIPVSVG